jgi:hypothetical protein
LLQQKNGSNKNKSSQGSTFSSQTHISIPIMSANFTGNQQGIQNDVDMFEINDKSQYFNEF